MSESKALAALSSLIKTPANYKPPKEIVIEDEKLTDEIVLRCVMRNRFRKLGFSDMQIEQLDGQAAFPKYENEILTRLYAEIEELKGIPLHPSAEQFIKFYDRRMSADVFEDYQVLCWSIVEDGVVRREHIKKILFMTTELAINGSERGDVAAVYNFMRCGKRLFKATQFNKVLRRIPWQYLYEKPVLPMGVKQHTDKEIVVEFVKMMFLEKCHPELAAHEPRFAAQVQLGGYVREIKDYAWDTYEKHAMVEDMAILVVKSVTPYDRNAFQIKFFEACRKLAEGDFISKVQILKILLMTGYAAIFIALSGFPELVPMMIDECLEVLAYPSYRAFLNSTPWVTFIQHKVIPSEPLEKMEAIVTYLRGRMLSGGASFDEICPEYNNIASLKTPGLEKAIAGGVIISAEPFPEEVDFFAKHYRMFDEHFIFAIKLPDVCAVLGTMPFGDQPQVVKMLELLIFMIRSEHRRQDREMIRKLLKAFRDLLLGPLHIENFQKLVNDKWDPYKTFTYTAIYKQNPLTETEITKPINNLPLTTRDVIKSFLRHRLRSRSATFLALCKTAGLDEFLPEHESFTLYKFYSIAELLDERPALPEHDFFIRLVSPQDTRFYPMYRDISLSLNGGSLSEKMIIKILYFTSKIAAEITGKMSYRCLKVLIKHCENLLSSGSLADFLVQNPWHTLFPKYDPYEKKKN